MWQVKNGEKTACPFSAFAYPEIHSRIILEMTCNMDINILVLFLVASCVSVVVTSSCSQKAFKRAAKSCVANFFAELKPKEDCR